MSGTTRRYERRIAPDRPTAYTTGTAGVILSASGRLAKRGEMTPFPPDVPIAPLGLCECLCLVWCAFWLVALCLPRPWFVALFKIAFPFMPDRLEDFDED